MVSSFPARKLNLITEVQKVQITEVQEVKSDFSSATRTERRADFPQMAEISWAIFPQYVYQCKTHASVFP